MRESVRACAGVRVRVSAGLVAGDVGGGEVGVPDGLKLRVA